MQSGDTAQAKWKVALRVAVECGMRGASTNTHIDTHCLQTGILKKHSLSARKRVLET